MIIQGTDTSKLGDQFFGCVAGRTLILDGDGPAYVAAATAKRLDTALRNYQQAMLTQLFMTQAQDIRIHLTCSNSTKAGRYNVQAVKPYQGNRSGKAKPALLEPLRQAVFDRQNWLPEYCVFMHRDREADDGMMQDAYIFKDRGIIWSDDKDLRMTPYPYWCQATARILPGVGECGWIGPKFTPSGTLKLIGQGPLFFWAQMLMGDQADHIQGVKLYKGKKCGPAGALAALEGVTDVHTAANLVIDAYREIDQNPYPEGYLLWLLRHENDSVMEYFKEIRFNEENSIFLQRCVATEWRVPPTTH